MHLIFAHIKLFQKNPTTFQINKVDFFEKLNLIDNDKYKRYEKITDNLILKSFVRIETEQEKSKGIIIYNIKWNKNKEFFEVDLNPNFMPYLQNFIDHYTSINLDNLVRFKSNHSLNLYKLICSWNDTIKTNQKFFELNLNLNRKR
ncbi:MAG: replication initiation protein [Spiroplasma ixodetis]|nr:replication initiation protein [Spiroplasma ixodetis]MBP1526867.1 replication initiation protein [Spiroplasma ixodetis]